MGTGNLPLERVFLNLKFNFNSFQQVLIEPFLSARYYVRAWGQRLEQGTQWPCSPSSKVSELSYLLVSLMKHSLQNIFWDSNACPPLGQSAEAASWVQGHLQKNGPTELAKCQLVLGGVSSWYHSSWYHSAWYHSKQQRHPH